MPRRRRRLRNQRLVVKLDSAQKRRQRRAFFDELIHTSPARGLARRRVAMNGQGDDMAGGIAGLDGSGDRTAIQPRHLHVKHDHVGTQRLGLSDGLHAIARLADHIQFARQLEQEPKFLTHLGRIVHDQHL